MATPFSPVTFDPEPIAIESLPAALAWLAGFEPMAIALVPVAVAEVESLTHEACAIGIDSAVKIPNVANVNLLKSKRLAAPSAANVETVEALIDCVALP